VLQIIRKDSTLIKKEMEAIDKEIRKLDKRYKIVGYFDQKGDLIVGEKETWGEAVERQNKKIALLAHKAELSSALENLEKMQ